VDTDKPTIQVSIDKTSLAAGQTATLTFILSEASSDFTLADIDIITPANNGGSISNLVVVPGSNGTQYTATYTAGSASGAVQIGVLSGKFSDAAGNANKDTYLGSATGTTPTNATGETNNWVSLTNTGASDTTAPTVAVSRMGSGTVGSAGETIVFTLSEASSDFTSADVTVTGGTLTNWTPVAGSNGTQYTATFVPTSGANGTATIGVLSNKFSDAAANFNKDTYTNPATGTDVYEANNQITLGYDTRTNPAPADTTAPTIAITASATTLNAGQTATVTFVLSEASTDFTAADVAVTGGTLSNFQVVAGSGNTEYTATFTPTAGAQGTGSVHVDSNAFRDAANNYNTDGAEANNTVNFITNNGALPADTTPPTIAITSNQAALTAGQTATITFTLSEASSDFVVGDVEVSGGTLSNFTGSGTTYTATFTPTANSTTPGVIKVASGKFSDAASNLNKDTYTNPATGTDVYEANNIVTLTVNTNASLALVNDTAAAVESGVANGNAAVTGTNPSGNVLTNDTGTTGSTAVTAIAAGSTTGTVGSALAGQFGSLTLNADGSYVYTVNNSNATVNALPAGSTLTDVFTYSVGGQTANLTVTITGTNDAPVYVANSLVNQTVTVGSALSYQFATTAFTDVDTGDTATYSATLADGSALPSWLTFNAATRTFTGTPPAGTTPGTISVKVIDTDSGLATANGLFNIVINAAGDTTPPTILVERANPASSLDAVGTETIIFTLSEASTTFDSSDIAVTGGTLSNFTPVASSGTAATGYTKYTAVFTPAANSNGTATIGVASGKFTDNAGNANLDTYLTPAPTGAVTELAANNTNLVSVVYDTRSTNPADNDKPTIQVSVDKTSISNGQTATLTFILSEASADFTLADIDVISGGGTVSNLVAVPGSNGVQYTATYTAGSTAGNVLIGVDSGKFADAAGNINNDTYKGNATGTTAVGGTAAEANNWVQLTNTGANDTTAPTVAVSRMGSGTVGSAGETIVFTLSEASADFVVGDVTVTGGALSNWVQISPTQYSATFVPTSGTNGTATIGVLAGKFSDAASNLNKDTYTNPATGTDVYEANNQVVLNYDARTNPAPADTTAPTIAISATATTLAAGATATVTFTLSEASTDFTQADVVVTGGTLSNWTQVNATEYTATFTPTSGAQGTGSVHVDSNKFSDAALNYNTDGADLNNTVNFITNNGVLPADTTPPTIAVTSNQASLSSGQTATITFTLSEASTDFVQGDVTVTGGTLSNWTAVSSTVYTATFNGHTYTATAAANGTFSVDVLYTDLTADADTTVDGTVTGTGGTAATATQNYALVDQTPPTIAVTRSGTGTMTAAETITFTLSEASTDFTSADVDVTGGTLSGFSGSGMVYTALFTPTSNTVGTASVGVKAGKFSDAATNSNIDTYEPFISGTVMEANNIVNMNVNTDSTPPTIAISQITSPLTGATTVTFTLSEASTDFSAADVYITPGSGSLSNWTAVSGTVYTATFTPTANSSGSATIGVAAGKFHDAAGNQNLDTYAAGADSVSGHTVEANNKTDFTYNTDVTPPTVAITGPSSAVNGPVTITFTLSEASSDFLLSQNDITVSGGGALSNFQQSPSNPLVYTATYTPPATSTGSATIDIASGKFSDTAGNFNADGGDVNNVINGSAGVDTLKLATGTVLNLETLTTNQTVKPIEQVEVFTMQGSSALTLSANDVLSLGGANASTMSAYNFSTTTGGTASTASTSKVQMVIHGTSSDTLVLDPLKLDNVTTNGIVGNTGLTGQWDYMGITTANGGTYKVYNQSTTGAQVLVDFAVNVVIDDPVSVTNVATFSSMTKDSSLATANADWLTNDASAGRLVSGTLASPLAAGDVVKVYANGALIGNATVNAAGTAWEITDLSGYTGNWTYTAQVVNSAGKGGTATVQQVNLDNTEAAPVITSVTDSTSTNIVNNGTTDATLSTVSGTGNAGDTIYLYDNTGTNLVGTTTVGSNGTWSINVAGTTGVGSNTFAARQVDAVGNSSVLSNLFTATANGGANLLANGDFSQGNQGFGSTLTYNPTLSLQSAQNVYTVTSSFASTSPDTYFTTAWNMSDTVPTDTSSLNNAYTFGTWSKQYKGHSQANYNYTGNQNPDLAMTGNMLVGTINQNAQTLWSQSVAVVAGQTYVFKFDYLNYNFTGTEMNATIDGQNIQFVTNDHEDGHFTATYTATTTKNMDLSLAASAGATAQAGYHNNFFLDNFEFLVATPLADNSLVAGGTAPATSSDNLTLTYAAGAIDGLAGNDTITAVSTNLPAALASGGLINGGAGVDTLKLVARTVLNLEGLTNNQTVKSIEQVEVVQMQGSSVLSLSANDVLSLGGSNTGTTVGSSTAASPMSPYSFAATSAGSSGAGTTSLGKVQFVVQGSSTDTLALNGLQLDGVTTNSVVGNTGLVGQWDYKGTVSLTGVDGIAHTYKVYDQSTTKAQVLVDNTMKVVVDNDVTITKTATFSSMTKDSSLATANADWLTNDGSAGRLVSGTLSAALSGSETLNIYANGTLLGTATVNGTSWMFTDTNAYTGNWAYTAQVVASSGSSTGGALTTQAVTLDNTEAAPVITAVTDSSSASIANNGSTNYGLSTVSGTGVAGDTIYLYDNTGTNLVGTTTVASNGTWTITGLAGNAAIGSGANTFSARMVDALGNASALSNLWKVDTGGNNLVPNGDFNSTSNYTTTLPNTGPAGFTGTGYHLIASPLDASMPGSGSVIGSVQALTTSATQNGSTAGGATLAWSTDSLSIPRTATGTTLANFVATRLDIFGMDPLMEGSVNSNVAQTLYQVPSNRVYVEAGKTYNFSFNYATDNWGVATITANVDGVAMAVTGLVSASESTVFAGKFHATYTANASKYIDINITANNTGNAHSGGDYMIDDVNFSLPAVPVDVNLVAGGTPPFTTGADGTSTAVTYTGGVADMLAGNDVLNIGTNAQTLLATSGNLINGSTGIDTLKLAAGTSLNLETLTGNQTVKSIEQVEIFELQGTSTLTLSANDVLSLGAKDAFSGTAGKVQFLIKGTSTDHVVLDNLLSDGAGGNTGLAGMWTKEASSVSYGGSSYNVYTHSTTGAQVLVSTAVPDGNVSVSASPLVLDLNGDGVQTTTLANGVAFDLAATGTLQQSAWVDRHDGLLALDLNGDGTINSGAELFGNNTLLANGSKAADGWAALAGLDSNADRVVSAADAQFANLRVWQDADTDGQTDSGELRTLADVGITSIALAHDASSTAQNGNVLDGLGSVTHADGSTSQITDAWLQTSNLPVLDLSAVFNASVADMTNGQAALLKLNVSDVLQLPTTAAGVHQLQVLGDSQDVVQLSQLFADGHAEGQWQQGGQVTQNGHTFNVYQYSGDQSLQVLIDQHIAQSNVHLS